MAKKHIGFQIGALRQARGLSMDQVSALVLAARVRDETTGERVTLSTSALSRIEKGKWLPSVNTLRALSKAFDIFFIVTPHGVNLVQQPSHPTGDGERELLSVVGGQED